jgi:predicted transcriptional regulator
MRRRPRSNLDIIACILSAAQNGVLQETIIQQCNLSTAHFKQYIKTLLETGLLNGFPAIDIRHTAGPRNSHMVFQTSRAGNQFLTVYSQLCTLVDRGSAEFSRFSRISFRPLANAFPLHRQGKRP